MALNLVNNESYEMVPTRDGTYVAPSGNTSITSDVKVRQVGNVVFISGTIQTSATWNDLTSGNIGGISGVDAPANTTKIPIITGTQASGETENAGYISIWKPFGAIHMRLYTTHLTDDVLEINGFYFV